MLNGGLVRFRNGRFQQFAPSSGAPRQGVRALLVDGQGRLWIGSNGEGLLRVDDPSADHPAFSAYTRSSGLSSDDHSRAHRRSRWPHLCRRRQQHRPCRSVGFSRDRADPPLHGRGWFVACRTPEWPFGTGTARCGLAATKACSESSRKRIPRFIPTFWSTPFESMASPRPISDLGDAQPAALSLSPSERQLQVDFGGLRHDLLYQTRLSGLDRDWTPPSSSRSVHYLSLAPAATSSRSAP